MPLYEYKCSECDELFEELRPIRSRTQPINCDKCGAVAEHVLSTVNTLGKASEETQDPRSGRTATECGGAGIRVGAGAHRAVLFGNRFENLRTGVSIASGVKVTMRGNRFKNVSSPVEVTDK
jgi:putative FmdB family regulatory protein